MPIEKPSEPLEDPVEAYAVAVLLGEIVAGPLVRAQCARHLNDLHYGPARGLRWDLEAALDVINFFEHVLVLVDVIVDGDGNEQPQVGGPFLLQPWQKFAIGSLFGWKAADGTRRFRNGYFEIAKGNGKSPMAAGIGLYMMLGDGEPFAECYAAAVTREQSKIMFRDAVNMVNASPSLFRRLVQSGQRDVYNLAHLESGSFFRPISSEGRGLDGKRVHCGLLDEVHEHPSSVVVDKMRAGTKGRRQALIVEITNSGFDRETVCWHHHEYSRKILEGLLVDDGWFPFVCGLDDGDDWQDPACWSKANPNLGVSVQRKYLEEQVREAQGIPAKQNLVRRLNFCEWTEAQNAWIQRAVWDAVVGPVLIKKLKGRRCWGGLDLSLAKDLTAFTLIFDGSPMKAVTWFWTPAETLRERETKDGVSYSLWRDAGHLIATPGTVVRYEFVAKHLVWCAQEFELEGIAFDEYRIPKLQEELDELDGGGSVKLVKHPQGFRKNSDNELWMPQSISELEAAILERDIIIQRNPVMTWCAAGAVFDSDAQANRKFNKRKATGRIDGVVSLAMAIGLAKVAVTEKPLDIDGFLKSPVIIG